MTSRLSAYSSASMDSASILSETSTLNSKPSMYDNGYGFSTHTLALDNLDPQMAEKDFLSATHTPRHRSRSPNPKTPLQRSRALSPNPHRGRPPRSRSRAGVKTQLETLAGVLGPDNTHHSTELDSIPCSGIRIPNGPFSGLLAWRLVVRMHPHARRHQTSGALKKEIALLPASDIRHAGNMRRIPKALATAADAVEVDEEEEMEERGRGTLTEKKKKRRMSLDALSSFGPMRGHGRTMTELQAPAPLYAQPPGRASMDSVASMPLMGFIGRMSMDERRTLVGDEDEEGEWNVIPSASTPALASTLYGNSRGAASSSMLNTIPGTPLSPKRPAEAVVANFLFDTSLGHNTISREALLALGLNSTIIEALDLSEVSARTHPAEVNTDMAEGPHSASHPQERYNSSCSSEPRTISLYLQNLAMPITFRLAPAGEPSRLGVQFLVESELNVRMGEGGRGVILWADNSKDMKQMLERVPKTIPLPNVSLKSKVLSLFGL